MNDKDLFDKLVEIEQIAINKYTDYIGITEMILTTLNDEQIKEYNDIHIQYNSTCFVCGYELNCRYCNALVKEKQTNN